MAERRTPEQKAADKALTAALEQVREAYHDYHFGEGTPEPGVLTDYVVIANFSLIDDEEDEISTVLCHPKNGYLPLRNQLSLARYATVRLEGIIGAIGWRGPDEG